MRARRAPSTGTKPRFPHQLSADMQGCGGMGWSGATLGKHPAAGLMGKQTSQLLPFLINPPTLHLWPPRPSRPSGGGFDSFIAEGLGGRRPFCLSLHSECLIPGSPFKPVCLLSVNTSVQPPSPGLSFLLFFSFCLCLQASGATSV